MTTSLTVQGYITGYWDLRAQSYHLAQQDPRRAAPETAIWRGMLRRLLPAPPVDVVDVGTGSGFLAHHLAGLGHRVTGLDLSEQMLLHARGRGYPTAPSWMLGDAVAPDLPSASVDAVTGRYMLWTLRDPLAAALSWHRLLRKGGRVIMFDAPWFPGGAGGESDPGFRRALLAAGA
ncbi:class I SAM-dependent methyltransferase [Corynebacterium pacaense]|uniref:class I SAM-dependent methyltransferase n=1 Tax=Corynebacterium pacaense TaxID=1816684 RepID=UPI0009BB919F|nr:methyltransferase domain-containing protein [Corynebacterium pacaense]